MAELTLKVLSKNSRVVVEVGALEHIGKWVSSVEPPPVVLLCSDETVAGLYGDRVMASLRDAGLRAELHTFPPGDASKNSSELNRIYATLGRIRLARDGMLLALGGGVVSDLTGFAAATWMRGVRYVTCPTTLEADVDAAIGGKTGINTEAGKNMVGAFHHADLVAVDPSCLGTLPARDLAAGLAESVKHACIRDAGFLDWHEEHAASILAADPQVLGELVERNLRIKAGVVEADETEQGQRAILNFGHTIGHAVEKWFQFELRHGEAVALGMVAAAHLSCGAGLLAAGEVERLVRVLERFGLPVRSPRRLDVERIVALTHGDKKVKGGRRRWVLLDGMGATAIRDDVDEGAVRAAVEALG